MILAVSPISLQSSVIEHTRNLTTGQSVAFGARASTMLRARAEALDHDAFQRSARVQPAGRGV
jgi:hypothetical protein